MNTLARRTCIPNKPEDDERCEASLDLDPESKPSSQQPDNRLLMKLLSPHARLPTLGSESVAGYDLYAFETVLIPAGTRKLVYTGLA